MLAVNVRVMLQVGGQRRFEPFVIRLLTGGVVGDTTADQLVGATPHKAGNLVDAAIR